MEKATTNKFSHVILTFLCIVTFLICFNVSVTSIKSAEKEYKPYDWFNNADPILNYKELQFIAKVKAIKLALGNQINEPALIATVMHKYGALQVISDSYDENYNSQTYTDNFADLSNLVSMGVNTASAKDVKNEQIDLLTAAAIVMVDSSGFGNPYNEEKYKEALAKDKMVGTNDIWGEMFNRGVCALGKVIDDVQTPFQFVGGLISGDTPADVIKAKFTRYANMEAICNNGYIGGVYENIQRMEDGKAKQAAKDQIAKEIIEDVNTYKELFGIDEEKCLYDTSAYSGDATNWRQAGSSWSNLTLGSGGQTVAASGCTVTSMAYLIKKSGTQLTVDTFDPGVFVQNVKFTSSMLYWNTWSGIAPKFIMEKQDAIVLGDAAEVFNKEVSQPTSGGYQRFIIIQVPGHWVAFDHIENGQIYVMDPAASAGAGLIPLNDVILKRGNIISFNTFYATDVPFGSSGSSSESSGSDVTCAPGDAAAFADFIASVEGSATCNYRGQGDGTGYESYDLGDGAGYTTAMGITERYQKDIASQVGYSDYVNDMHSGCTSKTYIDKMFPSVLEKYSGYVDANSGGLDLKPYERDAMTSLTYGGYNLFNIMADKIKAHGKESFEVFDCFKSYGCSWFASGFNDGLVRRRMAEYELFRKGNYNANRPTENYGYFSNINNAGKMEEYMKTHWPTSRK